MKRIFLIGLILFLVAGCAGMEIADQKNMGKNAALYGVIGAGAGAAISAVTHGKVGKTAVLTGIGGAVLGALNTPRQGGSGYTYPTYYSYGIECSQFETKGEQASCERGKSQAERQLQRERERRAYELGRGQ